MEHGEAVQGSRYDLPQKLNARNRYGSHELLLGAQVRFKPTLERKVIMNQNPNQKPGQQQQGGQQQGGQQGGGQQKPGQQQQGGHQGGQQNQQNR